MKYGLLEVRQFRTAFGIRLSCIPNLNTLHPLTQGTLFCSVGIDRKTIRQQQQTHRGRDIPPGEADCGLTVLLDTGSCLCRPRPPHSKNNRTQQVRRFVRSSGHGTTPTSLGLAVFANPGFFEMHWGSRSTQNNTAKI